MKDTVIVAVIVALVVGAAAFFGGMQYQKRAQPAAGQFNLQNGQGFVRRNGNNALPNRANRATRGEIISAADNNLTVKLPDSSTRLVLISDNTTISEATTAAKTALQTGKQVVVFGSNNADGSVTAQLIQLGTFPVANQPTR